MRLLIRLLFVFASFSILNFVEPIEVKAQYSTLLADNTLDSDYKTYLLYIRDTMGKRLPPQRIQLAQNKMFKALKAASLFTRIKAGYLLHSGSLDGAALVNFKSPGTFTLTATNTPFFYEGMGVRGTGSDGYLSCPYKSDAYSGIETDLTTVTYIPYYHKFSATALTRVAWGHQANSAGTNANIIYPFYTDNKTYFRHYSAEGNFANTGNEGLWVETYNGTQAVVYKNGTKNTFTTTPAAPNISINRLILTFNTATTTGVETIPADTWTNYISFQIFFDRFNDTDESTLRGILNTYISECNLGYALQLTDTAYCWFANPISAYDATSNKSWIGQVYAIGGGTGSRQYIFEINHATGVMNNGFQLGSYTQDDDHNEPSILLRSDRRLICAYTEHATAGRPIRWRISTNVADASAWGSENSIDPSSGAREYTYPSIFQVSNGDIYIFYRGTTVSTAYWYYIKSTDQGATFGSETEFWHNTYTNIYQDPADADILHFVGSPHPDETGISSIVSHFYFDGGADTWHESDGTTIGSLPITSGDATTIMSVTNPERLWFEDLVVDDNGYPRVLIIDYPNHTTTPELKHRYYAEWTGSAWTTPYDLGEVMDRNISTGDDSSFPVVTYTGGAHFDPNNPDVFYGGIDVNNTMEIFRYERRSATDIPKGQVTFKSEYDQWRPMVSKAPNKNVFWLSIISYIHYKSFNQLLINRTLH